MRVKKVINATINAVSNDDTDVEKISVALEKYQSKAETATLELRTGRSGYTAMPDEGAEIEFGHDETESGPDLPTNDIAQAMFDIARAHAAEFTSRQHLYRIVFRAPADAKGKVRELHVVRIGPLPYELDTLGDAKEETMVSILASARSIVETASKAQAATARQLESVTSGLVKTLEAVTGKLEGGSETAEMMRVACDFKASTQREDREHSIAVARLNADANRVGQRDVLIRDIGSYMIGDGVDHLKKLLIHLSDDDTPPRRRKPTESKSQSPATGPSQTDEASGSPTEPETRAHMPPEVQRLRNILTGVDLAAIYETTGPQATAAFTSALDSSTTEQFHERARILLAIFGKMASDSKLTKEVMALLGGVRKKQLYVLFMESQQAAV